MHTTSVSVMYPPEKECKLFGLLPLQLNLHWCSRFLSVRVLPDCDRLMGDHRTITHMSHQNKLEFPTNNFLCCETYRGWHLCSGSNSGSREVSPLCKDIRWLGCGSPFKDNLKLSKSIANIDQIVKCTEPDGPQSNRINISSVTRCVLQLRENQRMHPVLFFLKKNHSYSPKSIWKFATGTQLHKPWCMIVLDIIHITTCTRKHMSCY